MRDFYNKLCLLLLEESFGPIVGQIGNNLLYGTKTLPAIHFGTRLSKIKVNNICNYKLCNNITNRRLVISHIQDCR